MAEEDDEKGNDENKEEASGGGNKKKLILLIGVGVVVVALSVGGTLLALSVLGGDPPAAEMTEAGAEGEGEPEDVLPTPAIYYPLKPPIIVTYDVRGRQRYAQIELTLLTREDEVVAAVESHMPMIRSALVMLISGQTYEEAQTAEGKELLRQACLQELRRLLEQEIGNPGIEQVLYTNFVMQ